MSKTADLRKLIVEKLNTTTGATYYMRAPSDALNPYKVFTLSRVALGDLSRDDYELTVDIWDHGTDTKVIDEIADQLEELLNAANLPQTTILPTFFREARFPVDDPDKDIQHIQLTFQCQLYS